MKSRRYFHIFPQRSSKIPSVILEKIGVFFQLTDIFKCIISYEEKYVLAYPLFIVLLAIFKKIVLEYS